MHSWLNTWSTKGKTISTQNQTKISHFPAPNFVKMNQKKKLWISNTVSVGSSGNWRPECVKWNAVIFNFPECSISIDVFFILRRPHSHSYTNLLHSPVSFSDKKKNTLYLWIQQRQPTTKDTNDWVFFIWFWFKRAGRKTFVIWN